MYETLKRLYDSGKATAAGLRQATAYGWITAGQFTELTGQEYVPAANKFGLTAGQLAELEQDTVDKIVEEVGR